MQMKWMEMTIVREKWKTHHLTNDLTMHGTEHTEKTIGAMPSTKLSPVGCVLNVAACKLDVNVDRMVDDGKCC